jgi:glycine/D-amino acid oxidase-like deaminating enzyme
VSANAPDVAIVGGGILGCALAAFLAEEGARVRLYERDELAAGASGRNSGLLQHPMDGPLVGVFAASEAHYRELGHGFAFPPEAAGILVLG